MAKGRRTGSRADAWYNERDHLNAWDRLIGRRVASLRLHRKADSARTYTGPRRDVWVGTQRISVRSHSVPASGGRRAGAPRSNGASGR